MITIKLLGGAKKAVGKQSVVLERPSASISEILTFLQVLSVDSSRILNPDNLLVAINGVESSALSGIETVAKDGDTVSIVTVVHGGNQ